MGTPSPDFDNTHVTVPDGQPPPPPLTPYTKANIRDGYVTPQESQLYCKSEKYELFRKQNWFGAVVHPDVQIDTKLDCMISRILLELDHISSSIY